MTTTLHHPRIVEFETTKVGCRKTQTGRHHVKVELLTGYSYAVLKQEDLTKVNNLYTKYLKNDCEDLKQALSQEGIEFDSTVFQEALQGGKKIKGLLQTLRSAETKKSWHSPHPTMFTEGVVVHNTKGTMYRQGVIVSETIIKADPNGDKKKYKSKNPVVIMKQFLEEYLDLRSLKIRTYKL